MAQSRPRPATTLAGVLRAAGLGLLVVVSLASAAVSVYLSARMPGGAVGEDLAAEVCRAGYRHAASAGDAAVVDAQAPIVSRAQATVARTCRELRIAGALRAP